MSAQNHAYVTVFVPFAESREKQVADLLDKLGTPGPRDDPTYPPGLDARARERLRRFVHFMSLTVLPQDGGLSAYLAIEASADGPPAEVVPRLVDAMGSMLRQVIAETGNAVADTDADLAAYLEKHRVDAATTLFATPGLNFTGTPGMTVRRILDERRLAIRLRAILETKACPKSPALAALRHARSLIFRDVDLKWAFVSEPVPLLAAEPPPFSLYTSVAVAAFRDYLGVLVLPPALIFFISRVSWRSELDTALWHLMAALLAELAVLAITFGVGYLILRRQEEDDVPFDAEPEKARVTDIMGRENRRGVAQNHLAGVSILKPGLVRPVSLRFALWLIAEFIRGRSRPGFLDRIGTIHFARWILLPGTDRLVFLSNYDGSWQSYLEDFIARLRQGLTSVWSNTRDFPKTANLFIGGAGDGTRFKRWARRQQVPSRFWFSAYPELTTARIRTHAAMRHGFASASNETQAGQWLSLFGYAPPEHVERDEISALVFSGLPYFRYARCLIVKFGATQENGARNWLRAIRDSLSYGDHPMLNAHALVAGFTEHGLRELDLDPAALATFPNAFQEGMSAPQRARALGDEDLSGWEWGKVPEAVDAALLVYAKDKATLRAQCRERTAQLEGFDHKVIRTVKLEKLPAPDASGRIDIREPFGFRDGLSQPVMRGTRNWERPEKAMHVIEPGELLLGYKDNLGNVSPTPCSNGQDIGRNGTFLVIRQLEQDVAAFDQYIAGAARKLEGDERVRGLTGDELEHWIAASMVGRWRDGSSLVRNAHPPSLTLPRQSDNDFHFGREDPGGLRCPFGAHIRRANPRDSFEPGSATQLAISNRHRILRVGRVYEPEKKGDKRGLLFMCINADIERQFEFLQQTWILGSNFHGLDDEVDPIVGYRGQNDAMTIPTGRGPVRVEGLKKFVTVLGGAYFFVPGKTATRALSELRGGYAVTRRHGTLP